MPLSLYRRHRLECEASQHHPEDSRTYESDEKRKGYKGRCRCLIHVAGTLGGIRVRKSTNVTEWDVARVFAAALEAAGPSATVTLPPPLPEPAQPHRITVAEAIAVYLANREATVSRPTYRKYKTRAKQLQAFADSKGYVCIDQFRADDIDIFFTGISLGPVSKAKMLDWLRAFWRFAVNRDWIAKSPVSSDLKPPTGASRTTNKVPFTDEQLEDIIKACDQLEDQKWGNRYGAGVWTGEDLKDFIWLMTHSGLRISDAVLFDVGRLRGNEIFLRAKKNGGEVYAWIPDWLRDRLLDRAKRYGKQPFMIGSSTRLDTVTDVWRQRLAKMFELADVGDTPATPHKFRHTFARILLEKGVPIAVVAELMGDTEQVVRASYNRWMPERQAAMTKILKDAFADKPKLAVLKGGKA